METSIVYSSGNRGEVREEKVDELTADHIRGNGLVPPLAELLGVPIALAPPDPRPAGLGSECQMLTWLFQAVTDGLAPSALQNKPGPLRAVSLLKGVPFTTDDAWLLHDYCGRLLDHWGDGFPAHKLDGDAFQRFVEEEINGPCSYPNLSLTVRRRVRLQNVGARPELNNTLAWRYGTKARKDGRWAVLVGDAVFGMKPDRMEVLPPGKHALSLPSRSAASEWEFGHLVVRSKKGKDDFRYLTVAGLKGVVIDKYPIQTGPKKDAQGNEVDGMVWTKMWIVPTNDGKSQQIDVFFPPGSKLDDLHPWIADMLRVWVPDWTWKTRWH